MAGNKTFGFRSAVGTYLGLGLLVLTVLAGSSISARVDENLDDSRDQKIRRLEQMVLQLSKEVQALKAVSANDVQRQDEYHQALQDIRDDLASMKDAKWLDPDSWLNKFTLGGYGEMHANYGEAGDADQFDIHRLVIYVGYEFEDWIKLHSEIEIEHAFVTDEAGGELVIEQLYIDFLLDPKFNVRVGRILTPLGIINKKHEPVTFNGVERPAFAKFIIPSTWSSDGVGIFGSLGQGVNYELYVVGGLDGSKFTAKDGIREGRIKERASLHEPALTGRLDFFPLIAKEVPYQQRLRLGLSGYWGGLDNGNKGSNPGIDGEIHIYSADFEYSICKFDFRGATAYEEIDEAKEIGSGTATGIFGWYLEGAYHFLPDSWKRGKLKKADAVVFVRYDQFDTQHKMPSGVSQDKAGDREEWTFGLSFYPTPNLVLKADYQIRNDDADSDLKDRLNLGVGWQF